MHAPYHASFEVKIKNTTPTKLSNYLNICNKIEYVIIIMKRLRWNKWIFKVILRVQSWQAITDLFQYGQ